MTAIHMQLEVSQSGFVFRHYGSTYRTRRQACIQRGTGEKRKACLDLLAGPKSARSIADVESAARLRGFSLIWLPHLKRNQKYVDVGFTDGEWKRQNGQRW